jgi:large subunit ribosomal protein L7/L12
MTKTLALLCLLPSLAAAQSLFAVSLTEVGPKKIQVIKEVRTATGLGLKDAKDLVEGPLPVVVKGGLPRADADKILKALIDAGAGAAIAADGVAVKAAAPAQTGPAGFSVRLDSFGQAKIGCIKVVRDATGLGLADTKKLVESAPAVMKQGLTKDQAEKLAAELKAAGGTAVVIAP